MVTRSQAGTRLDGQHPAVESAAVYVDGLLAGLAGGAAIAAWFLLLDCLAGRPFYTPMVLGTAIFHGGAGLADPASLAPTTEVVLPFTWLHLLVFCILGAMASKLLALAERNPNYGFGVLLLFVVFEFGFALACQLLAEQVLQAIAWPAIVLGNLIAAAAMATVLWRRHPALEILP